MITPYHQTLKIMNYRK